MYSVYLNHHKINYLQVYLVLNHHGLYVDKVYNSFLLLNNTELSTKQIDSLTKLAKEIRESLKYLLEFKGQLVHKREETIIIQQVEIIQKVLVEKYPEIWTEIRDDVAEMLT